LVKEFSMTSKEMEVNWKLFEQSYNIKPDINILKRFIGGLGKYESEEVQERNDVYIYKTLRYPPKSTPPKAT